MCCFASKYVHTYIYGSNMKIALIFELIDTNKIWKM